MLWRFLVKTPSDFQEYDRRFVGQGMYLETISGDSLTVLLAVDTSGSINKETVQIFLGEVQAILRSYPHLRCELYFADTKVHGPHRLTASGTLPTVVGGGGTDFRPFFTQIPRHRPPWEPSVAIYMTDGFGQFPSGRHGFQCCGSSRPAASIGSASPSARRCSCCRIGDKVTR